MLRLFLHLSFLFLGYVLGQMSLWGEMEMQVMSIEDIREISVLELKGMEGDQVQMDISGPVRVLWNEQMVEGDGSHGVPLGQLATEQDRRFEDFPYVGNAKTKKFYPADSYPARGTHYRYRRFFESRAAAEREGFVASKLVK